VAGSLSLMVVVGGDGGGLGGGDEWMFGAAVVAISWCIGDKFLTKTMQTASLQRQRSKKGIDWELELKSQNKKQCA